LLKAVARSLSGGGPLPTWANDHTFATSLLLERFAGVGESAFALVEAASVLGVRFQPALAGELAGLDERAWETAWRRLVRAGSLEDLGSGWAAFVHPLFAQALLESRPPSERERAHARAFRLLVERGQPDAIAAEHALAARLVGDSLAIEVTARAGHEALAQGALEAACAHLGNAVKLTGEAEDPELLLDYAQALTARARVDEAARTCARVLSRADVDPPLRARMLALLARGAMIAARPADAEHLYEEAATAVAGVDPAFEAGILADGANTCQVTSPVEWTRATLSRALAVLPLGAPSRRPLEFLGAYVSFMSGDAAAAELITSETGRWSSRLEADPGWAWTTAVHMLNALKMLEDDSGATALFEREFELAVEAGAPILMQALAIAYADELHRLGRLGEALELVQRAMVLSDWSMAPWSDLALAAILSELGRDRDARPHIDVLRSVAADVPPQYYAPVSLWLCVLDGRRLLAAGESQRASELMLHAAGVARLTGWRHPCIVPWAGVGIDAHLAAGRRDRASLLIEELVQIARPLSSRWPRAMVALGRAQLAAIDGNTNEADRGFEQALSIFAELAFPIYHADALVGYGSYLRRSGRPREAREPLVRALELSEQAGAERVARLARAELAAAGGRRRRSDGHRGELTAQEQRVAALAAEGLSNAQIAAALQVSRKTVEHHLEHIYAKLGISSRRELIRRSRDPA
jgi:DNA-binding CsgD family transcriptional regulator